MFKKYDLRDAVLCGVTSVNTVKVKQLLYRIHVTGYTCEWNAKKTKNKKKSEMVVIKLIKENFVYVVVSGQKIVSLLCERRDGYVEDEKAHRGREEFLELVRETSLSCRGLSLKFCFYS